MPSRFCIEKKKWILRATSTWTPSLATQTFYCSNVGLIVITTGRLKRPSSSQRAHFILRSRAAMDSCCSKLGQSGHDKPPCQKSGIVRVELQGWDFFQGILTSFLDDGKKFSRNKHTNRVGILISNEILRTSLHRSGLTLVDTSKERHSNFDASYAIGCNNYAQTLCVISHGSRGKESLFGNKIDCDFQ